MRGGVAEEDGTASNVEGRKLNEDVASAKRANSVGDENPSGSASIVLVLSMTSELELVGAAGADELENPLVG